MAILKKIGLWFLTLTVAAASIAVTGALLLAILQIGGSAEGKAPAAVDVALMDRYDMYMTNQISSALDGVLAIEKVYWLSDDDKVAPEPNQAHFGTADSAAELGWLLVEAKELLAGQDTLFTTDIVIAQGSQIHYYLDDTIMVIVWKQPINNCMYTVGEVKLAHPSQFRRFLSGGAYGSELQLLSTQMASSVNAVLASSGDFYAHRAREKDELFPWAVPSVGVSREFLWRERELCYQSQTTPDCRTRCSACGANKLLTGGGRCG